MSNNQRLHFSTTDHPVLLSSITNNDNNESDVRSNSNVNMKVDEDSSIIKLTHGALDADDCYFVIANLPTSFPQE